MIAAAAAIMLPDAPAQAGSVKHEERHQPTAVVSSTYLLKIDHAQEGIASSMSTKVV